MEKSDTVRMLLRKFLIDCPKDFDFPLGGLHRIPSGNELRIVQSVEEFKPPFSNSLESLRDGLNLEQAYQVIILALRLAVLAVRTQSVKALDPAILFLSLENGLVDWRDTLRALSILEDCSRTLDADFQKKMEEMKPVMGDKLKKTIFEGYLVRTIEARTISAMGFVVKHTLEGILYVSTV
jgi:hypothetical protein